VSSYPRVMFGENWCGCSTSTGGPSLHEALELPLLVQMVLVPPSCQNILFRNGQPLTSRFPFDPSLTGEKLSTWVTPQIFHILCASTHQLEQRITAVENTNDELTHEAQELETSSH
jgi:hypothetical protein